MTAAATPPDALRLLAGPIAADIRNGSPTLSVPVPAAEPPPPGRGRPKSRPFAVVATPAAARAA